MKDSRKRLLEQLAQMAAEGKFGDQIKESENEYARLPKGIAVMLKVTADFCEETSKHATEIAQFRSLVCQLLIVAYREARRKDPGGASPFLHSLIEDYPGVPESALLPRWGTLAQASLALRELADSQNRLMVWQQASTQFQAYNEFLNGLLSYLIVLWRISLGKPVDTRVFDSSYANKIRQLELLTDGEDGPFYVFVRIARPRIRNAIAHGTIWLDSDAAKVRFTDNRAKIESEMDLTEFMALAGIGSHLAHSYLAAIAVIATMEFGTEFAQSLIPPQFVRLFNHPGLGE